MAWISWVRRAGIVVGLLLTLGACGGSGDSVTLGDAQSCGASNAQACPAPLPMLGDYFSYVSTVQTTIPAGTASKTRWFTDTYDSVNPDGSLSRRLTSSNTAVGSESFDARGAMVLASSTDTYADCVWLPPSLNGPVFPAWTGNAWNTDAFLMCIPASQLNRPDQLPTRVPVASGTDHGRVSGTESVTTPAGTFHALKIMDDQDLREAGATSKTSITTWLDTVTGRAVRREWSYTSTPVGQSAPSVQMTGVDQMLGFVFHGAAPVGATISRFAGTWALAYSATGLGLWYGFITVDEAGTIISSCTAYAPCSLGTGETAGAGLVSGAIDVNGQVTGAIETLGPFSGQLQTTYEGSFGGCGLYAPICFDYWSMVHR